jgi:hypothetical protein
MAISSTQVEGTYHMQGLCKVQYLYFGVLKFPLIIIPILYPCATFPYVPNAPGELSFGFGGWG